MPSGGLSGSQLREKGKKSTGCLLFFLLKLTELIYAKWTFELKTKKFNFP